MSRKRNQSHDDPAGKREPVITPPPRIPQSGRKRLIFFVITLLVPLALLVLLETALRYFSYGGDIDLVLRADVRGVRRYVINRSVAKRYFVHSGTVVPEPEDDVFDVDPGPDDPGYDIGFHSSLFN